MYHVEEGCLEDEQVAPAWERNVGLANSGNTCFIAAAHQILLHAPKTLTYLMDEKHLFSWAQARCASPVPPLAGLAKLYGHAKAGALSQQVVRQLRTKLSQVQGMSAAVGQDYEQVDAQEIVRRLFGHYDAKNFPMPMELRKASVTSVPLTNPSKFVQGKELVVYEIPGPTGAPLRLEDSTFGPLDELCVTLIIEGLDNPRASMTDDVLAFAGGWMLGHKDGHVYFAATASDGAIVRVEEPSNKNGKVGFVADGGKHEVRAYLSTSSLGPEPGQGMRRLQLYVDGSFAASVSMPAWEESLVAIPFSNEVIPTVKDVKVVLRKGSWTEDKTHAASNVRPASKGAWKAAQKFREDLQSVCPIGVDETHACWDKPLPGSSFTLRGENSVYKLNKLTNAYESSFEEPEPITLAPLRFPLEVMFGMPGKPSYTLAELWPADATQVRNSDWDRNILVRNEETQEFEMLEVLSFNKADPLMVPISSTEIFVELLRYREDEFGGQEKIDIPLHFDVVSDARGPYLRADIPESAGLGGRVFEVRGCAVQGGSLNGGHWWTFAKAGDDWFDFNDEGAEHSAPTPYFPTPHPLPPPYTLI